MGTTFKPLPGIHEMASKLREQRQKLEAAQAREGKSSQQAAKSLVPSPFSTLAAMRYKHIVNLTIYTLLRLGPTRSCVGLSAQSARGVVWRLSQNFGMRTNAAVVALLPWSYYCHFRADQTKGPSHCESCILQATKRRRIARQIAVDRRHGVGS